jgi:hypothetical protein
MLTVTATGSPSYGGDDRNGGGVHMYLRAVMVWMAQLATAIVNGAFREAVLVPRLGPEGAHVASTLLLCGAILAVTTIAVRWLAVPGIGAAFRIGVLWVALTLAFEFGAGHYLFGHPWERLLADYDLSAGRVWPLVLVTTLLAPAVARWLRRR